MSAQLLNSREWLFSPTMHTDIFQIVHGVAICVY